LHATKKISPSTKVYLRNAFQQQIDPLHQNYYVVSTKTTVFFQFCVCFQQLFFWKKQWFWKYL